ncbi:putative pentatricopeptide repeat-containing protein At1g53330 [Sesamum indicum]|uniref:Pentatricopeptide repeat-containing protein At1g53330 n=1 Tax=Sesamum indicum TaxID=4182 RepID=A0A6I9TIF4_SESIN|nr:putative pentatricopeptide repeat-containing protein At1g53330 [Sesamum indicum]XP_011082773.1 putative pentatricopeptide repeat-containing protein At1g53330 [Sesamum indicum]
MLISVPQQHKYFYLKQMKMKNISPFRLSSLLRLQNDPTKALHLFLNPNPKDPNPNAKPFRYSLLSYDLIISKLGKAKMFPEMEMVVEKLKNDTRIVPEEIIFCNIITYYGRARLPHKALQVFDEIPSCRCQRTIKSVNTLLNSLLMCREFDKIKEVFSGIGKYASPDACTYNILINAWCMRSDLERAWKVFDEMRRRGVEPNVVTFGTLIKGLCAISKLDVAFSLKRRMERDFKIRPNAHIYVALVKRLCKVGDLNKAIKLKDEMLRNKVELEPAVYSTLISAFFKAGRKGEVYELLEEMRRNGCNPDTVTYNAMIYGFCQEKEFDLAFASLSEMEKEGCKPDVITYNVIIAGLCREKKVREANKLLEDMPRQQCAPDVVTYKTLFDGLCDVQQFKEAACILDEMIFMGYVPHSSGACKYLDVLVQGKDKELWTCLFNLAKKNSIDRYIWRLITSLVCKDKHSNASELFNRLIKSHALSVR